MSNKLKLPLVFLLATLAGAVLLTSATNNRFSPHEKAFYASEKDINFVRPGLQVRILSAEIAQDGTIRARVRFTDPQGLPLDRQGIETPGALSAGNPSFIAAVFDTGKNEFVAYTTRTQRSTITNESALQAGTDTGGRWERVAEGEYTYTFGTKAPAGFNRSAVHAVGIYANRVLREFEMGTQLDDDVFYFNPATGQQAQNPRDIIRTATCHKCHGPNMRFHGETGRTSMQMCDLCHTSQTTDPDTRNTVDMEVMIHKIHMGEHLPSVRAGRKYQIIGFGNVVHDYSGIRFPAPMMKCQVCHEDNRNAANHQAWVSNPTRAACGACHDNVNFATGEGHVNLPQLSDNQCKNCHTPEGEFDFDASIRGAHMVPQESNLLTGLQWSIVDVTDATAGRRPTITFTARDKNGNPLALSQLNRVAVTMAGPTHNNYSAFGRGYVQEDASRATGANGTYTHTFAQAIPADARGTFAFGVEGRRVEVVLQGTQAQRSIQYGATNPVVYRSVDGSAVQPRDEPTTNQQCLTCHYRLAIHGENRVNSVQYCVLCHNPVGSDAAQRPAAQNPPETIDMPFMIHRIHGGEELHETFGVDYTVYGFGANRISFNEVRYPGELNQCFMCHQRGSENPTANAVNKHPVNTPRYPMNPMPHTTAACYGCHATNAMLSHAAANTTPLGESCSVCHGVNANFSATRSHANEITVSRDQATK